nr:hypothetical protein [Tanacetum cinerariifolium]
TQKKAKETELEDHLRTVKSSLNKASVVDSKATSSVIKSVSNVNSNLKCALFKRKVWKPTGTMFKTVGYIWKPTGRTFTLVGNVCPMTRISTATIVPPRERISIVKSTDKPVVTLVYTRKPKAKNVPNKMEPNKSWGSSSNVSSSPTDCSLPSSTTVPPLSKSFVKAGEMHEVPPSITGTFMPTLYKSDLIKTQVSYGLKSDSKTSETSSKTNDFVSCDNSDKSSDSEAYVSCDSSPETKTKDSPTTVDVKTVPESDIEDPKISKAAHHSANQPNPAGWSKIPAPVSAGRLVSASRPVSAGWFNPAARPYFRPSSAYFNNL